MSRPRRVTFTKPFLDWCDFDQAVINIENARQCLQRILERESFPEAGRLLSPDAKLRTAVAEMHAFLDEAKYLRAKGL